MDFQVIEDMATGLSLDALVTSHPVYIEVKHPSEIDEIFDSISYQKVHVFSSCITIQINCHRTQEGAINVRMIFAKY